MGFAHCFAKSLSCQTFVIRCSVSARVQSAVGDSHAFDLARRAIGSCFFGGQITEHFFPFIWAGCRFYFPTEIYCFQAQRHLGRRIEIEAEL